MYVYMYSSIAHGWPPFLPCKEQPCRCSSRCRPAQRRQGRHGHRRSFVHAHTCSHTLFIDIYVCMYECMYVCMYVCTRPSGPTRPYIHTYIMIHTVYKTVRTNTITGINMVTSRSSRCRRAQHRQDQHGHRHIHGYQRNLGAGPAYACSVTGIYRHITVHNNVRTDTVTGGASSMHTHLLTRNIYICIYVCMYVCMYVYT
jgi:hypothetical protein